MDETGIHSKTIAIIGLGLMGGSLALALQGKCAKILAVEKDEATIKLARQQKIVAEISNDPIKIIPQADIIILAAPVCTILALIPSLPLWHPGNPLVMDIGSTKREICNTLQGLPTRFHAIGGHPLCGLESSSLAHADGSLFQGAIFALCRLTSSNEVDCALAEALVLAVGALPLWVEPQQHDQWVAVTSHLPYLVANSLAGMIPSDARQLIGPGLRSTTRLAASSLTMMTDIIATNRDAILNQLIIYQQNLSELQALIEAQKEAELQAYLLSGQANYVQLMKTERS